MEIVRAIELAISEMAGSEGYDRQIEFHSSKGYWGRVMIKIARGEKPNRMVSWSPCMLHFISNNTIAVQLAYQDVIVTKTKIDLSDPDSIDDLYSAMRPYLSGMADRK